MQLVLNEDQLMLARTATDFVASTEPLARLRKLRDSGDALSFSPAVWAQIVELGWTGIPFSEADGGLGLGVADVVVVTEALGRLLAPEPFVPSVMLGARTVALAGNAEQKAAYLSPALEGKSRIALAHDELRARGDLRFAHCRAERTATGYRLNGEKSPVLGGVGADVLCVVARTSGGDRDAEGLSLFVVSKDAPGVVVQPLRRVDGANAATLTLRNVDVNDAAVLGEAGKAFGVLETVIDGATVALAGEMLGGMAEALERTLQYLKEREQFGVKIGTFQALQHRAARLFIEVELARSAVMAAARALDEHAPNAKELVSIAKARASDGFSLVANEAVQMFGGIGMTDEHDIGFFMKRAKALEITLGDAAYHRRRFADLRGF